MHGCKNFKMTLYFSTLIRELNKETFFYRIYVQYKNLFTVQIFQRICSIILYLQDYFAVFIYSTKIYLIYTANKTFFEKFLLSKGNQIGHRYKNYNNSE